jgi:methyl-accepting chemotaxis protein
MKMKPKMLLGSTAVSLAAVLFTTFGIVTVASNLAGQSLQSELQDRLILQRDLKKEQITRYIKGIGNEVAESAGLDGVFSKALVEFSNGFSNFQEQTSVDPMIHRQSVESYYTEHFSKRFTERNAKSAPVAVGKVMTKLSATTLALQNYYMSANPNPLGEKQKLVKLSGVDADYAKVHAKYHPRFRDYLNKWGFHDIFLVDAKTGYVVYSVFKELDYATSLINGPYAKSGLADAFKNALSAKMQGKAYTTRMKPYYPSYNDFASFVSSPLYINGQLQGVFIIQMPLDNINKVMTFDKNWADYGLGESGETYLVAEDYTMRNDSRFFIEDSQAFVDIVKKSDLPAEVAENVAAKGTTIGMMPVKSKGSEAALAGKTGFEIFADYRGTPVLSAYAPLSVAGLNWAILAEIDEAEAFAPVKAMVNEIIKTAVMIGLGLLALSLLLSFFFVNSIVTPITYFRDIIEKFKEGDNDIRVKSESDDEVGELATAFDELLDEREKTLAQIIEENETLNESIIEMLQVSAKLGQGDLTARMVVAEDVTGPLSDSLNLVMEQTGNTLSNIKQTAGEVELTAKIVKQQSDTVAIASKKESEVVSKTVQELGEASQELNKIAELARQCNLAADDTIDITDEAQQTVQTSIEGINSIRDNISETEKRIKRLGERSQEIAGVTGIINGIAEKTHVLSLNASMQAASAGDAGRGFAVVATEIQRLAESASEATTEIGALIKNIQVDTADTVNAMNKAITQVVEGTQMAEKAGSQMQETRNKSGELVRLVQQIASSSQQQVNVSQKLQKQAEEIQQSNNETAKQLSQQSLQTDNLVEYSVDMLKSIGAFKV